MNSEEAPPDHGEEQRSVGLTKWQRRGVILLLLVMAGARFLWPSLPIDATTIGLLGLAFVFWKLDIESLEIWGLRARGKVQRLEEAATKMRALAPPTRVETPDTPPRTAPGRREDWYARASAAATDLDVPTEPVSRVLWSTEQIRIELTVLAGNAGHLTDPGVPWSSMNSIHLASILVKQNVLETEAETALRMLQDVRNQIAHGQSVPHALVDAADSVGMELLARLRGIPREWIRVVKSNIAIYSDRARTRQHSRGILLVQLDDDGHVLHRAVYPYGDFLPPGQFVTWEWDGSRKSDEEGWYEDPDTQEVKLAWSRSLFFAGRPYPEQWGLMYRMPRPEVGLE